MEKTNKERINRKFRYSVFLDLLVMMIIDFIIGIIFIEFTQVSRYLLMPAWLVFMCTYYFFGDGIFGNGSFGMKIMNLAFVRIKTLDKPSVWMMAKRRFLLLLWESSFHYRLKNINMDKTTNTMVTENSTK